MKTKIANEFLNFYDLNIKHIKSGYFSELKDASKTEDFKKMLKNVETQLKGKSKAEIDYNKDKISNSVLMGSIAPSLEYLDFEKNTFEKILSLLENNPTLKDLENKEDEYNKKFLEELFKSIMAMHHNFINIFKFLPIFSITNNVYDYMGSDELLKTIDKNLYDKYEKIIKDNFNVDIKDVMFNKDCLDIIKIKDKFYFIKELSSQDKDNKTKKSIDDLEIKTFPFICS